MQTAVVCVRSEHADTSVSDVSDGVYVDDAPLEVTHGEYLKRLEEAGEVPTTDVHHRMRRRNSTGHVALRRRFSLKPELSSSRLDGLSHSTHTRRVHFDDATSGDAVSIGSGHKSLRSMTSYTVSSHETVKMSNIKARKEQPMARRLSLTRAPKSPPPSPTPKESSTVGSGNGKNRAHRWSKIKRLIGGKFHRTKVDKNNKELSASIPCYNSANHESLRERAKSEATLNYATHNNSERRVRSSDDMGNHDGATSSTSTLSKRQQEMLDQSIRGRLDGVDILFLGGAQYSVPFDRRTEHIAAAALWQAPFHTSFTGISTSWTPRQMVTEMLWSSAGKDPPEIVLEGIYPGIDSRWTVQIEAPRGKCYSPSQSKAKAQTNQSDNKNTLGAVELPPMLQTINSSDANDANSPKVTSDSLRRLLWGTSPVPADVLDMQSHEESPMQLMASRCSIPIDVDDDTLVISTRDHMQAVHDMVRLCLSNGQFDLALHWLETLLQSLAPKLDPDLRSIRGATLHNIGLVQMWIMNGVSNHQHLAVDSFQGAYDDRKKYYPPIHPDLTVSIIRKAVSYFAGSKFNDTVKTLERALTMIPADHIIRAKALNNLGVAYYCNGDNNAALKELTQALEIQRRWLDGPVRRETTVYDASVTLCNMGKVYLESGNYELSIFVFEEALLLLTTIFRTDHDMVLSCLMSLAMAKARKGQLQSALQVLQGCLRSQNARFGALSGASIETIGLSGYLYAAFGDYESGLKCVSTVRKWQQVNLGEEHLVTESSTRVIRGLEVALKAPTATTIDTSASRDMVWV